LTGHFTIRSDGAGDVKLFSAIGAVTGVHLVMPTFFLVLLTGGLLAMVSVIRAGAVKATMYRVLQIFIGFLPGWKCLDSAYRRIGDTRFPTAFAITLAD